jgi:hypothetical protein
VRPQRHDSRGHQVDRKRGRRQPEGSHDRREQQHARDDFERVMTLGRRDVDRGVAVMDEMQAPQQPHPVERAVLPVFPQVEQQKRQRGLRDERPFKARYQTGWAVARESEDADRQHHCSDEAADQVQPDVARPARRR